MTQRGTGPGWWWLLSVLASTAPLPQSEPIYTGRIASRNGDRSITYSSSKQSEFFALHKSVRYDDGSMLQVYFVPYMNSYPIRCPCSVFKLASPIPSRIWSRVA